MYNKMKKTKPHPPQRNIEKEDKRREEKAPKNLMPQCKIDLIDWLIDEWLIDRKKKKFTFMRAL